jgi:DNA repair protein RecN (Recombination protein N)
MSLPTLIFDEVDAGISGETAMRVGRLMEGLGRKHQIICITHLPQMAGRGKAHFRIFKQEDSGRTITKMNRLYGNQRIEAIARMIGGETLSESSLSNARELLN